MSGAYTHLTLENVMKEPSRLEAIQGFPEEAIISALDYFKFCELGAVSPDYPYLVVGDSGAAAWADAMHYTQTGQMIHAGIRHLRQMDGEAQKKGLAWLLGYTAHVVTDMTIHPVVNRKIGHYAENKTAHRVCEMNQDVYIFQRLNLGDIVLAEHLNSGIGRCSDLSNPDVLDQTVLELWQSMLQENYPKEYVTNPPDINKWHKMFKLMVGGIADEGDHLWAWARHVAAGCGLVYPKKTEIDMQYVENLDTPWSRMHFDEIFDLAIKNVEGVWLWVAKGVLKNDETYREKIVNGNLDTGEDTAGQLVFWKKEK
jgi:hypothetical protein